MAGRLGYLPYLADSRMYERFVESPVLGTAAGDRLMTGQRGGIAGGLASDEGPAGNQGRDVLCGHSDNDALLGRGKPDVLNGADDRDRQEGGKGGDALTGGAGRDRLVFDGTSGQDRIADYETGTDEIVITGGADSFADLSLTQSDVDTIPASTNTEVTLHTVTGSSLGATDFTFA